MRNDHAQSMDACSCSPADRCGRCRGDAARGRRCGRLDVPKVVAQARAAGLRQLWIRTGGTPQGWYGRKFLDALLPAAHAAGIAVVAWDFPKLSDPVADAKRATLAVTGTFAGQHIDAFSPDIETVYEGTFNTGRRVQLYLSIVRHAAGNVPIVATVMR